MQLDVTKLTPEAHKAIVECLKIAARRGRQLREAREREQEAGCAGSPQNNAADETDKGLPPEGQSHQAGGNQQNRSDSHPVDLLVDTPSDGTKDNNA